MDDRRDGASATRSRTEDLVAATIADLRVVLSSIGEALYTWNMASDEIAWGGNAPALFGLADDSAIASGRAYARLVAADSGPSRCLRRRTRRVPRPPAPAPIGPMRPSWRSSSPCGSLSRRSAPNAERRRMRAPLRIDRHLDCAGTRHAPALTSSPERRGGCEAPPVETHASVLTFRT